MTKHLLLNPNLLSKLKNPRKYYLPRFFQMDPNYSHQINFLDISMSPRLSPEELIYLDAQYEQLLEELSDKLNIVHNTNDSAWEYLIGPWLRTFIFGLFVKWKSIQSLELHENILVCISDIKFKELIPLDFLHFESLFYSHEFHEHLFFLLTKFSQVNTEKLKLPLKQQHLVPQKKNSFVTVSVVGSQQWVDWAGAAALRLKTFIQKIMKTNCGNASLYHSLTASKQFSILHFFFSFQKLYRPAYTSKYSKKTINRTFRFTEFVRLQKISNDKLSFTEIASALAKLSMPQAYLEGFDELSKASEEIFPSVPNIQIFSSTAQWNDDLFKRWLMQTKCLFNSDLFIYQHGGTYGTLRRKTHQETLERKISTKFLTWGWDDSTGSTLQLFAPSFFPLKKILQPRKKRILVILTRIKIFSRGDAWDSEDWNREYLELLVNIAQLSSSITEHEIIFRLHPSQMSAGGFNFYDSLKTFIPNLQIDMIANMEKSINLSSLVISTQNSTVFLKALKSGTPTLGCWNSNLMAFSKSAELDFNELEQLNIFFPSPENLITHIVEIEKDIFGWWRRTTNDSRYSNFLNKYYQGFTFRKYLNWLNQPQRATKFIP